MSKVALHSTKGAISSTLLQRALILLTGIVAYGNAFTVPMQFDDFTSIGGAFENFSRGGFGLFSPGASRWVADATFAFNKYLHGLQVGGFHAMNLAIHLGAALCVYALLKHMVAAADEATPKDTAPPAFIANFIPFGSALLFVSHPIQTEAVTYIAQRYTSLAALFYLLSLYCYFCARKRMVLSPMAPLLSKTLIWWLTCVLFAVCAMKSKQTGITLPIMMIILELACYRGYLVRKAAFALLMLGLLAIVPLQELSSRNTNSGRSITQMVQKASSESTTISRYSYFLTEQRVEATYLRLLLFPVNQNLDYDYPVFTSIKDWPVLCSLFLHLLLVGAALYLLIRSQRFSDSMARTTIMTMRLTGIGIVWFYVTLAVESSFIPISDVIFEHRLYLPSIGFFMAATAGVGWLAAHRPWLQRSAWSLVLIVATVLTAATIARNKVWGTELSLWQNVLEKSPNKARPRSYVGMYFGKKMMLDKAIQNFVRAIELDGDNDRYRIYLNHALVMVAGFEKRASSGIRYQSNLESVDESQFDPWLAVSYNNLGLAYEYLHNPVLAKKHYYTAIALNPNLDLAWFNLALMAAGNHDTEAYKQAVNKLEALNPALRKSLPEQPGGK